MRSAGGDEVRLVLITTEPLSGLVITDRLADGTPWTHTIEHLQGTAAISFPAGGTALDVVPTARWSYP